MQRVASAIGKAALHSFPSHAHAAFWLHALHGHSVELIAIDRVRVRSTVRIGAWHRQPQQQCQRILVGQAPFPRRRLTAAIVHVTGRTRPGQKVRPQAIAGGGAGRRLDPVTLEEGVADDEARVLLVGQVGGREREGLPAAGEHGGRAAGLLAQRVVLGRRGGRQHARHHTGHQQQRRRGAARRRGSAAGAAPARRHGCTSVSLVMPTALAAAATTCSDCAVRL